MAPLIMFALYSPNSTYDGIFLANYSYININDQMTRVPGIASVSVFGAGQYAMRLWVRPDRLAQMGITVPEIINAIQAQNNVNPPARSAANRSRRGRSSPTRCARRDAWKRRRNSAKSSCAPHPTAPSCGSRTWPASNWARRTTTCWGASTASPPRSSRSTSCPDSNAVEAADGAKELMAKLKKSFPPDMDYVVALDTTLAVTEGMKEIEHTLVEALVLVIIVVFIFLQGWRATLIPLLAVPVSLVGTFALFPLFGFSINTLSLFGLVLAIGLVVDDAIVVVEAVEHHIEHGLSPKDAALKAMEEVSGPVIAIAIILAAVFIPTAFIPGITGRLYQQFAVTIAVSVIISAFNALTLRPRCRRCCCGRRRKARARCRSSSTGSTVVRPRHRWLRRRVPLPDPQERAGAAPAGRRGRADRHARQAIPTSFLPDEDQGYVFAGVQLPDAASLQRTDDVVKKAEEILKNTPGVKYYTSSSATAC